MTTQPENLRLLAAPHPRQIDAETLRPQHWSDEQSDDILEIPPFLRASDDDALSQPKSELARMENIVMDKGALEKALVEARESHLAQYRKAYMGWLIAIQRENTDIAQHAQAAQQRFKDCGTDDHNYRAVSLERPENFERDYNRVLKMVGHSVNEHIQLRKREYECYVLDEWPWREAFQRQCVRYALKQEND